MKRQKDIKTELEQKKERLRLYLARENEMLSGGAQSYGLGTRNVTRYNTDLAQVRAMISELERDISLLESRLSGKKTRKAVGVVPRDW